jgi:hypothetical protein
LRSAQTEAPADREIQQIRGSADIGGNTGNSLAGQGLLGHPEQVAHIGGPHDHQIRRIEAKMRETGTIGQAKKLRIRIQLQVEDGHALRRQQPPRLPQGKSQACSTIADSIGIDILHQPAGRHRKIPLGIVKRARPHFGQRRLAFDIGNDIPQRRKALL